MDFTFVVNSEPENRKRRTVQGACDRCRRRKKRCIHHPEHHRSTISRSRSPEAVVSADSSHDGAHASSRSAINEIQKCVRGGSHENDSRSRYASTPPRTTRFVGDLNPEASMLVETQNERAPRRDRNSLGIWLDREHDRDDSDLSLEHDRTSSQGPGITKTTSGHVDGSSQSSKILLPDTESQKALLDIYFLHFNPLLPILDEDQIRKEFVNNTLSHTLLQAILLVISKDYRSRPFLRLTEILPSTLSPSQFTRYLYGDLKVAVNGKREHDRVCLIQTLALLSLHTEGGRYGAEDSSMHLAMAIHHAQTIGLHIGISKSHSRSYDRLFWSLWCLSTLDASSNGRPRLINEHDIGIKVNGVLESSHPAFRIMITLSGLLSTVIRLYQPTFGAEIHELEMSFPSFETIVQQSNGWELESSVLISLELYYHAIAILSYRTRSTDDVELAEPSTSSLRQALAAQQIMQLLRHTPIQTLLPLPTVPYAISLALSQTYRQFRRSRLAVRRKIAQEQLECYVVALDNLAGHFQSAHTMAAIGHKVLDRILRLNDTAHQAAESIDPHGGQTTNQQRGIAYTDPSNMLNNAELGFGTDKESGASVYGNRDNFGDYDGLFTSDGTLQAIDTLFDNFMGLDLPNDLFSASLADDTFRLADQP